MHGKVLSYMPAFQPYRGNPRLRGSGCSPGLLGNSPGPLSKRRSICLFASPGTHSGRAESTAFNIGAYCRSSSVIAAVI